MFSFLVSLSCCCTKADRNMSWHKMASGVSSMSLVHVIIARYRTRHCVSDRIYCPHFEWRHGLLSFGSWRRVARHVASRDHICVFYTEGVPTILTEGFSQFSSVSLANSGMLSIPPTSLPILYSSNLRIPPMLATFVSIKAVQLIQVANLWKTIFILLRWH